MGPAAQPKLFPPIAAACACPPSQSTSAPTHPIPPAPPAQFHLHRTSPPARDAPPSPPSASMPPEGAPLPAAPPERPPVHAGTAVTASANASITTNTVATFSLYFSYGALLLVPASYPRLNDLKTYYCTTTVATEGKATDSAKAANTSASATCSCIPAYILPTSTYPTGWSCCINSALTQSRPFTLPARPSWIRLRHLRRPAPPSQWASPGNCCAAVLLLGWVVLRETHPISTCAPARHPSATTCLANAAATSNH